MVAVKSWKFDFLFANYYWPSKANKPNGLLYQAAFEVLENNFISRRMKIAFLFTDNISGGWIYFSPKSYYIHMHKADKALELGNLISIPKQRTIFKLETSGFMKK